MCHAAVAAATRVVGCVVCACMWACVGVKVGVGVGVGVGAQPALSYTLGIWTLWPMGVLLQAVCACCYSQPCPPVTVCADA